ncbi:hypothetical protein IF2G_11125 [Cordyceps javanica]|nr:hypothetical protein IF2G_11125 [Cordyceps javanica]
MRRIQCLTEVSFANLLPPHSFDFANVLDRPLGDKSALRTGAAAEGYAADRDDMKCGRQTSTIRNDTAMAARARRHERGRWRGPDSCICWL